MMYHVQPAEECALVGKEGLWLDLHRNCCCQACLDIAGVLEPAVKPPAILP